MNIYRDLGLKSVINANGKMTILGASAVCPTVAESMQSALQNFVVIDDLMDYTGSIIAQHTGAAAGCPTCGAASGIAIAVAASIAGTDLGKIEQIPDTDGLPNTIILQKGHAVQFGGNLTQMIRLGGGSPVEVGCTNQVEAEHIAAAIDSQTAALLYVKSHHAVQKGMQSLETMLELARRHALPLIVDAAAEEDLRKYTGMGADMVLYSGGKALGGPTSGFIAGDAGWIAACRRQYKGIGRAMKVSKEAMVGLITALEQYGKLPSDPAAQKREMQVLCDRLNARPGLRCAVRQDEAGREIYRAEIHVDAAQTGLSAAALSDRLKRGEPAIYLREYYANQGLLSIDPRPLFPGQADTIVQQIGHFLTEVL